MPRFEVKEEFYLDQKPFKILSGAIHYFRIHPDDWFHSLYNLKALGFNTVETYIPWNLHESRRGDYQFDGGLNFEKFLDIAADLGLYAIVRPSPFICAEWEFGGLPAWLLNEDVRVRSFDSKYLAYLSDYYDQLLPKLVPRQLEQGGNILMFQVENEYGSYGQDKDYLKAVKNLMISKGITSPLFTSDGPWRATLRAGSLIEEDVLVTGNFGSRAKENFAQMQDFFSEYDKTWPLMCMEFWDGWFNRWKEPVIRRDPHELAQAVLETIKLGSINLYMFHGGTNFAFMNGCSARGDLDLPQVTSYDYDAILDEQGNPSPKFYALQELLKEAFPELTYAEPLVKKSLAPRSLPLLDKVSLFDNLDNLATMTQSFYPQTMEELGQNTGYILYRSQLERDADEERLRLIDARDRAQIYLDSHHLLTQGQEEIGQDITFKPSKASYQLDILIENMGRVNYGHKLTAHTQRKGLGRGAMMDLHFIGNWQHYPLPLESLVSLDFSKDWQEGSPSFYRYGLDLDEPQDTYLDMSGFGKGVVFVNDHNLGRFWEVGPTLSLYLPKGFLKQDHNEIVVFETEGIYQDQLDLLDKPLFKEIKGENL